ncbi:hypothetical protein HPB49_000263 [Dermacentor silvarum]|uniref:Uncharacterized protein n=1 Tax=Dermacentor silvarum TaxID=543639 RepID=A0ACB8DT18_DERSI|nr:hypothetical protein HPB49_000263 [Dermacentor silvarum]
MFLPNRSVEQVATEFELSGERSAAKSYEDYVSVLSGIMLRHMVHGRKARRRNGWWDREVAEAWHARGLANQEHRRALKAGEAESSEITWKLYLQLKRTMQAMVQAKLAEANIRQMQSLRAEGKSTAQSFWRYVKSLDRQNQSSVQITDETGQPVADLKECVTQHLERLYRSNRTEPPCTTVHSGQVDQDEDSGGLRWEFTPCTIDRAISRVRTQTASGQDGISARLVKSLGPNSREQLADLFTGILNGVTIPSDWRLGRVSRPHPEMWRESR